MGWQVGCVVRQQERNKRMTELVLGANRSRMKCQIIIFNAPALNATTSNCMSSILPPPSSDKPRNLLVCRKQLPFKSSSRTSRPTSTSTRESGQTPSLLHACRRIRQGQLLLPLLLLGCVLPRLVLWVTDLTRHGRIRLVRSLQWMIYPLRSLNMESMRANLTFISNSFVSYIILFVCLSLVVLDLLGFAHW